VVLGPKGTRVLAHGFYDLTNRANHKLRLFLMYVMAAVRVRNVPGARHLAHEIDPSVQNGLKEQIAELLPYVGWQRAVISKFRASVQRSEEE
jgi:hypothetical protein